MVMGLILTALAASSLSAESARRAPLRDPVFLNIGFVCRWQTRCITNQQRAMKSSLHYVNSYRPPAWKVQVCNRNSSRGGTRKDWTGFNNCIRNSKVLPPTKLVRNSRR